MKTIRTAIVRNAKSETIERYLPVNYACWQEGDDVVIEGTDMAGWTLDGYVIPRLASGLHLAEET